MVGMMVSQTLWGQQLEWRRLGAVVWEKLGNLISEMV